MASSSNGNLMDEFEEAFQACLHALTKQESNTGVTKEEMELEVEQTASKFIDLARQMEAFFLQKRFLISVLKPEMFLKDENQELRHEITRKELLIQKHYSHLEQWKAMLMDQQQGYNKQIQQAPGQQEMRPMSNPGNPGNLPQNPVGQMGGMVGGGITGNIQAQLQQQHLQAQQQQSAMLQAQQQMQMQQMQQVGAQQMYMQQGGPVGGRGAFNQGSNVLQGPLAYLEKTTSNIDLVGMGDGRR